MVRLISAASWRRIMGFLAGALWPVAAAWAQATPPALTPPLSLPLSTPLPGALAPAAQGQLALSAVFPDGKPIRSGLVWRIVSERGEGAAITARSTDTAPTLALEAGPYVVHVAYGFASGIRRVTVTAGRTASEQVPIAAGALKLAGAVGDAPIPTARISFSIFVPQPGNSEGRLVLSDAKTGEVVRLPEGNYHVVSTYGDANAIQRADIKVESGKVTEATLNHRAARVTLKLVANNGGEAFAGTAFSVLTPGGDVIREAIGAFPQVILAEGDYVLIARQEGQVFTRDFKVDAGLDRDIEVLARAK